MIVNVSATHTAIVTSQLSRHDLLSWVNTTLKADFTKVDELCTGAAYCQLMHSLYPKVVPIKRVKFCTNIEHEFIDNFKILQTVFQKLQVQKAIPIDRLVRGKFQDNIEFLQWFKNFYDANDKHKPYDAMAVRNGQPMAFGSPALKKKTKCYSTSGGGSAGGAGGGGLQPQHSYREENRKNNVNNDGAQVLKRSLTRTELRHDLSMQQSFSEITENTNLQHELLNSHQVLAAPEELGLEVNKTPAYFAHAALKLERILTYCLEAKAAGESSVDISKIKHIIYTQPVPTESEVGNFAQLGAGDHVEVEDFVEEN